MAGTFLPKPVCCGALKSTQFTQLLRRPLGLCQAALAAIGGTASVGRHAIALWAMTRAPVASVAALRETSVLFATVLGTWMLKEEVGWQRAIGTVVIVGGVMALRLA